MQTLRDETWKVRTTGSGIDAAIRKDYNIAAMKSNRKSLFVFIGVIATLLIAAAMVWPRSSGTSAQDNHIQAFTQYVEQLEHDGLVAAKEIRVEGTEPFIFVLRPDDTHEITDQDVLNITELALRAVSVFESRGGLRHDDIDIAFHRPAGQNILLIKRQDMPETLSADAYGEMTISIDTSYFTSLVNLAGPRKNGGQDYANSWSVVQALCIAYAGDFPDSDPVCNIISANAAASWVGMEREQAAEIINGYGMTQLGYLGNKDYRYRFIDFVFDEFARK